MSRRFTIVAAALVVATSAGDAAASWTDAASMNHARTRGAASALPDGRVLHTGGLFDAEGRARTHSSAELYEPATDTWTLTAPMSAQRSRHQQVTLADGRVLVAGGRQTNGGPTLAAAEVFDPATGAWSPVAPMATPRDNYALRRLHDGRVLAVGGVTGDAPFVTATAEIFDPATGRWSPAGRMSGPRFNVAATVLTDGRVLVTGGASPGGHCVHVAQADVFDPRTGDWHPAAPMSTPRGIHTATLLPDGRVLVAGGNTNPPSDCARGERVPATDSAELYDPRTDTWSQATPMSSARRVHDAAPLPDGRVLLAGGRDGDGRFLLGTEAYDPVTNRWAPQAPLNSPRNAGLLTALPDGGLLLAGGDAGLPLATAERFTN